MIFMIQMDCWNSFLNHVGIDLGVEIIHSKNNKHNFFVSFFFFFCFFCLLKITFIEKKKMMKDDLNLHSLPTTLPSEKIKEAPFSPYANNGGYNNFRQPKITRQKNNFFSFTIQNMYWSSRKRFCNYCSRYKNESRIFNHDKK